MSENSHDEDTQQLSEEEVRELARSLSPAVLKRLEEIALHGSEAAAVQAGAVILDHAWGRHRIVTKHPGGVIILPAKETDELQASADKMRAKRDELLRARERC